MIFSKWNLYLLLLLSALCTSFVFMPGNFGDFSRSLGVFTILLLQSFTIHTFLPKLIRQINAALLLSSRKNFPPGATNPWRYNPAKLADEDDLNGEEVHEIIRFSMTNTLLTIAVVGAIIGSWIAKPIPLFPSWLGAILSGVFLSYFSTLSDARGDLLRFIGYSTFHVISEVVSIANDVSLLSRVRSNLSKLFFFFQGIDDQFQVFAWIRVFLREFLVKFTAILYR